MKYTSKLPSLILTVSETAGFFPIGFLIEPTPRDGEFCFCKVRILKVSSTVFINFPQDIMTYLDERGGETYGALSSHMENYHVRIRRGAIFMKISFLAKRTSPIHPKSNLAEEWAKLHITNQGQ